MIAKVLTVLCLLGLARAGHLYGGYGGYAAVAPAYAAVAPAYAAVAPAYAPVAPAYAHAPALSHVSQYSVYSSPIVKAYAPVSHAYSSPYVGHSYAAPLSYGYSGYGYGGYANKYGW